MRPARSLPPRRRRAPTAAAGSTPPRRRVHDAPDPARAATRRVRTFSGSRTARVDVRAVRRARDRARDPGARSKAAPATRAGSLVSSERLDARLPPRPGDAAPANAGGGPGGSAGHIRSSHRRVHAHSGSRRRAEGSRGVAEARSPRRGPRVRLARDVVVALGSLRSLGSRLLTFCRLAPPARRHRSFRVRRASAPFRVGTSSRVFAAVSVSIACVRAKETARVVRPHPEPRARRRLRTRATKQRGARSMRNHR